MKTPMNLNQKSNLTEAHYVALRVLVAMMRDKRIGAVACRHAEVCRAVVWLTHQFGGIEGLGEASQLISQEQRDLRRMYEMGVEATGIRGAVRNVLDYEIAKGHALTTGSACWIAEMVYTAIASHIDDMFNDAAMRLPSKPEDPLPDACLAISSEE
jgi:hypothetical protein